MVLRYLDRNGVKKLISERYQFLQPIVLEHKELCHMLFHHSFTRELESPTLSYLSIKNTLCVTSFLQKMTLKEDCDSLAVLYCVSPTGFQRSPPIQTRKLGEKSDLFRYDLSAS